MAADLDFDFDSGSDCTRPYRPYSRSLFFLDCQSAGIIRTLTSSLRNSIIFWAKALKGRKNRIKKKRVSVIRLMTQI